MSTQREAPAPPQRKFSEHVWVVTRGYCGRNAHGFPVIFRTMRGVREYVGRFEEFRQTARERRSVSWWNTKEGEEPTEYSEYIFAHWQPVYP